MKPSRLLLLFLSVCPLAVYSQTAEVGGAVQDPSGAVIPKASVEFRNQDTGVRRQTSTNGDGAYHLVGLDPGKYDATVQANGFKTLSRENITFQVGDKAQIDFKMQVGETSQSVTVDGSGQQINTTNASVSTVIDRQFVANIPLNGRSFQSLETLSPGVLQIPLNEGDNQRYGGEFSVNGQRAESNYFTVDGVSANTGIGTSATYGAGLSGSIPGESALGTTQSLVSVDALQEFRATTSTYSAEYGRSPGGQFSFVTRSGTDAFHGSLFDYFRNDIFDASNWFNGYTNNPPLPKAAERQNNFGGTLGGPFVLPKLGRGKRPTFFFVSYEGMRLTAPQTAILQQYPSASLRSNAPAAVGQVLKAFPIPNGADLGNGLAEFSSSYSNPATLDSTGVRFDHSYNDKLNIFGRYSHAPSENNTHSLLNLANVVGNDQAVDTLTVGATASLTRSLSTEFRFNYTKNTGSAGYTSTSFGGAIPYSNTTSRYSFNETALTFGQPTPLWAFGSQNGAQSQLNLVDTVSAAVGKHALKFGIDYRRLSTKVNPYSVFQEAVFTSEQSVLSGNMDVGIVTTRPIKTNPIFVNFSAFAQDEWRVSPRLSLSLGIRWDVNPSPGDGYGNIPYTLNQVSDLATATLAPKGTPLWQTTYANFAPRVGVAYIAHSRTGWETVVRTGGGVFFDPGNELGSIGISGIGYSSTGVYVGTPYPFTTAQLNLPEPSIAAPYSGTVYANDPHLKAPYTTEWNLSLQQGLGKSQTFTLGYLGSTGRKMLLSTYATPYDLGNQNFTPYGSANITRNASNSSYNALQTSFQRQLSRGLQSLVAYTWSHSIDDGSSNFASYSVIRGSSDYDVRHNLQLALTYDLPWVAKQPIIESLFSHWSLNGRVSARSGLPFDVTTNSSIVTPDGMVQYVRADLVPGQPTYLYGSQYPGGRIFNYYAFTAPADGGAGTAPRNQLRGFSAVQVDPGVQKAFSLSEQLKMLFRAEAFNVFNHPNFGQMNFVLDSGPGVGGFGYASNTLNSQLGGLNSLYQTGGPRSMQFSLRVQF